MAPNCTPRTAGVPGPHVSDRVLPHTRLQDQLATLQATFEASKAAATAEIEQKTSELDSLKNKLLTERTANRRQMEMSAEVCLQHDGAATPAQQHVAQVWPIVCCP